MLELIAIKTENEQDVAVSLDMFQKTQVQMVRENPLFEATGTIAEFSMSFSVPPTIRNLKMFGFPDRITSLKPFRAVRALIRHSGITISEGEFILIRFDNFIQLQFRTSADLNDQKAPMDSFFAGQKDFEVNKPAFVPNSEENLDYTSQDWGIYKYNIAKGSSQQDPNPFCIAPVKREGTSWEGHEGTNGARNGLLNYMNFYNILDQQFSMDTNISTTQTREQIYPVVPFFPVWKVVQDAFGDTLPNNPFNSDLLKKVVMVGNFHHNYNIEKLYLATMLGIYIDPHNHHYWEVAIEEKLFPVHDSVIGPNLVWLYKSFLSKMRFNEFFNELIKVFGMTLYRGKTNEIVFNNDIFDDANVQQWDDKLHGYPEVEVIEAKDYIFEYAGETADTEESFEEYDNWNEAFLEAASLNNEDEFNYKAADSPQILKIKTTIRGFRNQRWLLANEIRSGLMGVYQKEHTDDFKVTSKIKPLRMTIDHCWFQHKMGLSAIAQNYFLRREHWHVPVLPQEKENEMPYIMLWSGKKQAFDQLNFISAAIPDEENIYPYLTNHHTDIFGNKIHDFSLMPTADDGIVQKFHSKMKQWVEKEKIKVQAEFNFSPEELARIKMKHKVHVRGKLFFIEKIEFSLSHKNISKVKATLIEYK